MMKWGERKDAISTKNIHVSSNRYGFNYVDYCFAVQKAKAQDKEINLRPQIFKANRVLSHHIGSCPSGLKSLCDLLKLFRLF